MNTSNGQHVNGHAMPHLKKRAFLAAFAELGSVTHTARAAGIRRETHYKWLHSDPEYARAFREEATPRAADTLEAEAVRRAMQGVKRFKFYQGKPILDPETKRPYYEHDYSDVLLIFLLKGLKPERYGDRRTDPPVDEPLFTDEDRKRIAQLARDIDDVSDSAW